RKFGLDRTVLSEILVLPRAPPLLACDDGAVLREAPRGEARVDAAQLDAGRASAAAQGPEGTRERGLDPARQGASVAEAGGARGVGSGEARRPVAEVVEAPCGRRAPESRAAGVVAVPF